MVSNRSVHNVFTLSEAEMTARIIRAIENPHVTMLGHVTGRLLCEEKGVKTSINPDAHSTRGLQDLYFGTKIARKGWLTRKDVINTLPLGKIENALVKQTR